MTPIAAKPPLQLNDQGQLRHFLSIDGLSRELLNEILDTADSFLEVGARAVKKVPLLRGMTVCNVFFENSTRTRTTFELAAKRLSADVITLNVSTSSTSKGETLTDTLRNLEAMAADMFVVRHADSGAAHFIAEHVCPGVAVINGGDGRHAHPTQGMLDMLTIRRHKGRFENLSVAIVGDILHSRVARSNMEALKILGCPDIRVIGPKALLPVGLEQYGVRVFSDVEAGLKDVDVIIMLRLQRERMQGGLLPSEGEFFKQYGLSEQRLALARPDAIVMHPGPINRGMEIMPEVADSPRSTIVEQVANGVSIRMAVLYLLLGAGSDLVLQSDTRVFWEGKAEIQGNITLLGGISLDGDDVDDGLQERDSVYVHATSVLNSLEAGSSITIAGAQDVAGPSPDGGIDDALDLA